MRNIFTLASILVCSGFISIGQTDLEVTQLPNRAIQGCTYIPTVIQSTGGFDKEVTISQSEQNLGSLDITDPEIDGLVAKPNPTKGPISIKVPPTMIGQQIQVYDMTGRLVANPTPITMTSVDLTIEGEPGIYLIMIKTEKNVITERILLE